MSFGCGQPSLKSYGPAGWRRGLKQKPTTVASRGFLLNWFVQQAPTASSATTTARMTACNAYFNIVEVVYYQIPYPVKLQVKPVRRSRI